uniref:protein LSM14 homolog B-B-like n=1 Tax=Oncorhynchus gorbuscha TaxID=8017 RepID=UPI001EAEF1E1|nr:protein LSM14 homolog B-B-like [Oncorhynchus gorbuscha]
MVPSYNQLAASSLLSQQYTAALGMGAGLHSLPVRRGLVVEQAVQTVPADNSVHRSGHSASQQQRTESGQPPECSGRDDPQSQRTTASSALSQPYPRQQEE